MFLLKCKILGLSEFQSIFNTLKDAEKYLETINPESIEDWSIHPLFVQESVKRKDNTAKSCISVSVQRHGDGRPISLVRNISVDNLYELVFKDFDFKDVYKIILFPHA